MYKILFFLCFFTKSNYEINYNEKINTQITQNIDFKPQSSNVDNFKDPYCPIFIKQDVDTKKVVNIYFKLKDLVIDKARYILLNHKYRTNNPEDQNRYNHYADKLNEKTKQIELFIKNNKSILNNFKDHINTLEINLNLNFFENMYTYAQNNNKKKNMSKKLYLLSKNFTKQNFLNSQLKKINEIKNKNIERVDMFFENKKNKLNTQSEKIYLEFHKNIEKLALYQERIFNSQKKSSVEDFINQYKKILFYYNQNKKQIFKMKNGYYSSTYCNEILFSTYSINLLIDFFNKSTVCIYYTSKKIRIPALLNIQNNLKIEIENNNKIIKKLLRITESI